MELGDTAMVAAAFALAMAVVRASEKAIVASMNKRNGKSKSRCSTTSVEILRAQERTAAAIEKMSEALARMSERLVAIDTKLDVMREKPPAI